MDAKGETHYDVLGLEPRATRDHVEKAYHFCLEMYSEGAIATYSLLEVEDMESARARIHEAYEVLSDPGRRRQYDEELGLPGGGGPRLPFPAPSSAAPEPPALSPEVELPLGALTGAQLKRLREARGVSLRDIAQASKIGLRFLEYIEQDRFPFLPAAVYLRGFLHEYARALGLDPRSTAEAYLARIPKKS